LLDEARVEVKCLANSTNLQLRYANRSRSTSEVLAHDLEGVN